MESIILLGVVHGKTSKLMGITCKERETYIIAWEILPHYFCANEYDHYQSAQREIIGNNEGCLIQQSLR